MQKCQWWLCENLCDSPYCSIKCANKYRVDLRRREVKLRLIEAAGGKCSKCGYAKSPAALEFHHKDPSRKRWDTASGNTTSYELLLEEVQECDLLCANCHRELENSLFEERWVEARKRLEAPARTRQSVKSTDQVSVSSRKARARTKQAAKVRPSISTKVYGQ